ncbi:hypothetical protein J14TS5_24260 [Paenibacillus lautus]|nr:hypothetical protein J14TS5_24260 [Paenibacillus lautus]
MRYNGLGNLTRFGNDHYVNEPYIALFCKRGVEHDPKKDSLTCSHGADGGCACRM